MKHMKRTNTYKNANCFFDPNDMTATSYRWWHFVKRVQGKVVFNAYRYSSSTSKHQAHVRRIMKDLGIEIDLTVELSEGLQNVKYGGATLKSLAKESARQVAERKQERRDRARFSRHVRRLKKLNAEGLFSEAQWAAIRAGESAYSVEVIGRRELA